MTRVFREGDRSAEVADIQARLRSLGISIEDDSGVFGPSTNKAVRDFQQRRGILVDGLIGADTWRELVDAGWRIGDRVLYLRHPHMRGDDVLALQKRLNALGFDVGASDGIFGVNTEAAVRLFQREYAVHEDGIFGPHTHTALAGLRVDRQGTAKDLRDELRRSEVAHIRNALVVLDPGHGGADEGGRVAQGLFEADLCWDLAQRVAVELRGAGAQVLVTRERDEEAEPAERAARANEADADVFVSLHLNENHESSTAEGTSTFFYGGSRSGETLAETIQEALVSLGLRDCRSHARSFSLLKMTRMPAVIVEPIFMTNPREADRMGQASFRARVADAIARGIARYFELES